MSDEKIILHREDFCAEWEDLEGKVYTAHPGYTAGEHWNGWLCPRFTKEEGMKVIQGIIKCRREMDQWVLDVGNIPLHRTDEQLGRFDEEGDAFIFNQDGDPADPTNWDVFKGDDYETVDGTLHLYPIGAWCWTWSPMPSGMI